jgi:hypothetical protein
LFFLVAAILASLLSQPLRENNLILRLYATRKGDIGQNFPINASYFRVSKSIYIVKNRSPLIIFSRILRVFSTGACIISEVLKVPRTASRGHIKLAFPLPPRTFFLCVRLYSL